MICEFCGSTLFSDETTCFCCGRPVGRTNGKGKKNKKSKGRIGVILGAAVLVLAGIGIGMLIPRLGDSGRPEDGGRSLQDLLPGKNKGEIRDVYPMADGAVAVLYDDGAVKVSGNAAFADAVADWSPVERLYYFSYSSWKEDGFEEPALVGITQDGNMLSTAPELPAWTNIKELYYHWQGLVALTNDGYVLFCGAAAQQDFLAGLQDVEALANMGDEWYCLKKDGSVISGYTGEVVWTNVKEVRSSDHGFYAIRNDGTAVSDISDNCSGLTGAVKIVDYEDWLVGMSADGRLMTENGGSIYENTGDMVIDAPGMGYYGEEIKIDQFTQVKDIVAYNGVILLNRDGTARCVGGFIGWDLSAWTGIEQICGGWTSWGDTSETCLYGIRQDGSVIQNLYVWDTDEEFVMEQYLGWKVRDIFPGYDGAVAITTDGGLVGDGIYSNTDFSVFDR